MVLGSWDKHVYHKSLSEVSDDGTFIFGKPPEIPEIEGNLKILNGNMGQHGYRWVELLERNNFCLKKNLVSLTVIEK